jgi:hypothetical protein
MAVAKTSLRKNSTILEAYRKRAIQDAQENLLDFTLYTNPLYETGWFNELLCAELDNFQKEVEAGNMPRLMIFAPPRSGKSELASRRFPAKILGNHPDWNVIACSYSSDLANRMSRDAQRIVGSKKYAEVFPDTLLPSGRTGAGERYAPPSFGRWSTKKVISTAVLIVPLALMAVSPAGDEYRDHR